MRGVSELMPAGIDRLDESRSLVFALASAILFLVQTAAAVTSPGAVDAITVIVSSALVSVALALTGIWIGYGGVAVIGSVVAQHLLVPGASTGMLAVYIVVALWVAEGWWIPSAIGLIVAEGSGLLTTDRLIPQVLGMAVGSAVAVGVGLLIRAWRRRVKSLESSLVAAEVAMTEHRSQLNAQLHDRVASKLVALNLIVGGDADVELSGADRSLVRQLGDEALASLRAMIVDAQLDEPLELISAIPTLQTILKHGDMSLEVDGSSSSHVIEAYDGPLLALLVWEGCVNALKYGARGGVVRLSASEQGNDRLLVSITNEVEIKSGTVSSSQGRPMRGSTRLGLRSLKAQMVAAGGSIESRLKDGDGRPVWSLTATIPRGFGAPYQRMTDEGGNG